MLKCLPTPLNKLFWFIGLVLLPFLSQAQLSAWEINQLQPKEEGLVRAQKVHIKPIQAVNPFYWLYRGSLGFYQGLISPQIASNCIYEVSCSRFSSVLVQEFGVLKGGLLSLDRITRCNRVHHAESSPLRYSAEGRIRETISDYH
ncbi:membrane protein insertion efficiency factor YidD [Cytophagales bacterium LB-30]|uniref:Membrane protein insertion efficiency factor YidD n=1 Tax=Shiella aurantiaca TaxID=3058365 RepID=A0ABT8F4U8_9BACT|nr:membrane protein insertion efficiency factor YidD [Shiella aurantiaca]MDN4165413.1 membrane protein insertion efficiency factor YidD [Shiella aurantiaca]